MNSDIEGIGINISTARRSVGISQEMLADKIGKSRRTIQNYETGKTDIPFCLVSKIASALEVPLESLVGEIPDSSMIGSNIRRLRIEKGMTQKELGERCGMFDSAIRRYENGRSVPTLKTIDKIADALDITREELLKMNSVIGVNIREARKAKGLTQDELAEKCGMKRQQIGAIENNENGSATIKTIERIASGLDVTAEELLSSNPNMDSKPSDSDRIAALYNRVDAILAAASDNPIYEEHESRSVYYYLQSIKTIREMNRKEEK